MGYVRWLRSWQNSERTQRATKIIYFKKKQKTHTILSSPDAMQQAVQFSSFLKKCSVISRPFEFLGLEDKWKERRKSRIMGPQMVSSDWDRQDFPRHFTFQPQVSPWLPDAQGNRKQIPSHGARPPVQSRPMHVRV